MNPIYFHANRLIEKFFGDLSRKAKGNIMMTIFIVAFSVITIAVFTGNKPSGSSSNRSQVIKLNAEVSVSNTYLSITNNDDFDYERPNITINNDYTLRPFMIPNGGATNIELSEFANEKGERFNPYLHKPKRITIFVDYNYKEYMLSGTWD